MKAAPRLGLRRLGIAGPVGTGKTALVWRLGQRLRDRRRLAVITNDIDTLEDAGLPRRPAALPADRIVGVETGGCPMPRSATTRRSTWRRSATSNAPTPTSPRS